MDGARERQDINNSEIQEKPKINAWLGTEYDDNSQDFTLMNQTKTGSQLFQRIKQMEADYHQSAPKEEKEYRAKTKGRFAGTLIPDQASHFSRD